MKQNSRFQANSYFTDNFILETRLMVTPDSLKDREIELEIRNVRRLIRMHGI